MSDSESLQSVASAGPVEDLRRDFLNATYQIIAGLSIHDVKNASLQRPFQQFSKTFEILRQSSAEPGVSIEYLDGILLLNTVKVAAHFSIVEAQKKITEAMELSLLESIRILPEASQENVGEFFAKMALHINVSKKPRPINGAFTNIELRFVDPDRVKQRLKSKELLMSSQYALHRYFMLQESTLEFFQGISKNELKTHRRLKRDLIEMVEIARVAPYNLVALSLIRPETGDVGMDIAVGQALGTSILSCLMAQEMGFSFREQVNLGLIGLFYNVGLVGGEEMSVVLKSSSLTPIEYRKVLDAQASGVYKLIQLQGSSRPVLERLLAIFEFSRAPQQSSVSLALESRLLRLVSQYVALTSERPFREPYLPHEAIRLLGSKVSQSGGGDLDPLLYYLFVRFMGPTPVGSLVMLNNQQRGIVYRPTGELPGRPMVKTVIQTDSEVSRLLDLGLEKSVEVARILDPKREGVNVVGYFFD